MLVLGNKLHFTKIIISKMEIIIIWFPNFEKWMNLVSNVSI